MKNNFLLIIILICGISTTFGQGPERRVYATAGKVAKCQTLIFGSTNTVSYTIGEPIVKWSNVDGKRIHNGFQQPDQNFAVSPNVTAIAVMDPSFLIYPNPFNNYTIIQGPDEQKGTTKIQLIDQNGKLINLINDKLSIIPHYDNPLKNFECAKYASKTHGLITSYAANTHQGI